MSAIALNNRVTSYSDSTAAFVSCTALPIPQSTLNFEEMAGIDGLWDWEEFAWTVGIATVAGAIGGGAAGAAVGAMAGGLGAAPGAAAGAVGGAIACGLGAAIIYTLIELKSELQD